MKKKYIDYLICISFLTIPIQSNDINIIEQLYPESDSYSIEMEQKNNTIIKKRGTTTGNKRQIIKTTDNNSTSTNIEIGDKKINQVFLSLYQEWLNKQLNEKKKRNALLNNKRVGKIKINQTPTTNKNSFDTIEEQLIHFRKQIKDGTSVVLSKKGADSNVTIQPKPQKQIFGIICQNGSCFLLTDEGIKKQGDEINNKKIIKITSYRVLYSDKSTQDFIRE